MCQNRETLLSALFAAEHIAATFTGSPASKSTPHLYLSILPTFSADSSLVKTWVDRFRDLPTLRCSDRTPLLELTTDSPMRDLVFSSDGKYIAAGSFGGYLHVWDAATGSTVRQWSGWEADGSVYALAFSPNSI